MFDEPLFEDNEPPLFLPLPEEEEDIAADANGLSVSPASLHLLFQT